MPQPDFTADDPFEVLGVNPPASKADLRERAQDLVKAHPGQKDTIIGAFQSIDNFASGDSDDDNSERETVGGTTIIPLQAKPAEGTVESREDVTVTVTNDQYEKIENASLRRVEEGKSNANVGLTDENGEIDIHELNAGTYSYLVTKDHPDPDKEYKEAAFDLTVEPKSRSLRFVECPDKATVGDTISVEVHDENGTVSNCIVGTKNGSQSASTDASGRADIAVNRHGTVTLTASKGQTSTIQWSDATTDIQVYQKQVDLQLTQVPSKVSVGDTAKVRVTDGSSGVRGVDVSHAKDSALTNGNGYATLSFEHLSVGTDVTISATKQDQGGETFDGDTATVTVTKKSLGLDIACLTRSVTVGEPTTFEVTNTRGNPVEDAYVDGVGTDGDYTNGDGEVSVVFDATGRKRVQVSKSNSGKFDYGTDDVFVDVSPRTVRLSIDSIDRDVEAYEDVSVVVHGKDDDPESDVKVIPENGTTGRTDVYGKATIRFQDHGKQRVRVEKGDTDDTEFVADRTEVAVAEPTKELQITDAPNTKVSDPVRIKVVNQRGQGVGDITVRVNASGVAKETKTGPNGLAEFDLSDVTPPEYVDVFATDYSGEHEVHDRTSLKILP